MSCLIKLSILTMNDDRSYNNTKPPQFAACQYTNSQTEIVASYNNIVIVFICVFVAIMKLYGFIQKEFFSFIF